MQTEIILNETSIGAIVAADFRAAEIFKSAGIDFCCGGNKSIESACREKEIDPSNIYAQLDILKRTEISQSLNFNEWELGFLADYIINTHHKYVLKTLPDLLYYSQKIANVHGSHHPELHEVAEIIIRVNSDLLEHLKKEEEIVFPAIKRMFSNYSLDTKMLLASEIEMLAGEHEFAGEALDRANRITNNYIIPEDACNTYQVAFKLLKQFEDDLHVHVHLENNILFPKALKL